MMLRAFGTVFLLILIGVCKGKIHLLTLSDDERSVIVLTSFGYLKEGFLEVNVTNLKIHPQNSQPKIGFSFDKSSSSGTSSYVEREESTHGCVLDTAIKQSYDDVPRAIMTISEKDNDIGYELKIRERLLHGLQFYKSKDDYDVHNGITSSPKTAISTAKPAEITPTEKGDETIIKPSRKRRADPEDPPKAAVDPTKIPVKTTSESANFVYQDSIPIVGDFKGGMNFSFYVRMDNEDQSGLYELYFHNCENSNSVQKKQVKAEFQAHIVEMNADTYLSAGEMSLPLMYGVISIMFFIVGVVWVQVICSTPEKVFKIHYLMAVIIFTKGLSVMFHSLDYYFIAKDGHTEAWAIIFYIVHLLKGILLIICLLLIGTGWAFIKYILSDRDKKLFMIVIPMQVMVNVAYIIMEETEEGNRSYYTWKNIVILVDVLCCGAILIPVVWSIRHLQEASQTDGKAAINLSKLQLFRHFYIMVICYLYFTRIIVYLLEITIPFKYVWISDMFSELGAFVFFSVTGYKFRPGCDNPYLKLEQYDSDDDVEEAITRSGATEGLSRVNKQEKDVTETDEFDVLLPKQGTTKV